ncbi:putative manganese-dependent inorganic diphosphatase [Lachnospiraceae bacterium NSJ-143]|nr:putative manganese-dependent inorganic diphosphatase [Lachnospiraceae bacterium NSJ-143]
MKKIDDIIVTGHKNPDTDSICSAIAYANLKNAINGGGYVAMRAGDINKETEYVLNRFKVEYPQLVDDVRTRVCDIELKKVEGVSGEISIKEAYLKMKKEEAVTLAVTTDDGYLEGIISIGDIASSDMDVYDNTIVSKANTSFKNIVDTLDGKVVAGDISGHFSSGKVFIGANTPDMMDEYLSEGDLVILGNRFESQYFAIEKGVRCIVLGSSSTVSPIIKRRAEEKGCIIISSPYDTFTIARLIDQSMPVKYFMSAKDLLTFSIDDFTNDVKETMAKNRHRYFPVINENGKYMGQISKRSFLDTGKKKIILVDHNERNQAVNGVEFADILEIIDHHRLGNIETINPVFFRNEPVGCTATIVYKMYNENNVEIEPTIAGLLCSAILSDTLMFRSPTCTDKDREAALRLAEIAGIEVQAHAEEMFKAASDLASKTSEEIFYSDFKKFKAAGVDFGVGQITSMNSSDLESIRPEISKFMDELLSKGGADMLIFMLTNIIDESTTLLFKGARAKEVVQAATNQTSHDGETVFAPGMVSRKKQLIPQILAALQQ